MRANELPELFKTFASESINRHRFDKAELVFRQGTKTGGLWYVLRGQIDLQRVTDAGHLILIHRALPGEFFAEASLFTNLYHCSARSLTDSELLELNRNDLHDSIRRDPDLSLALMSTLASQVQLNRRLLEIMSVRNAQDRVCLGVAHGLLGADIMAFAARIGLSHEAVYRALARLNAQGKLIKTGRGIYKMPAATTASRQD